MTDKIKINDVVARVSFDMVRLAVDIEDGFIDNISERIMDLAEKLWEVILHEPISDEIIDMELHRLKIDVGPAFERIKAVLRKSKFKEN